MTKSELWILSEWWVACDRARRFEEQLLTHRHKTPFAEIDLLMSSGTSITLLEVKTYSQDLWATHLISRRQVQRLIRARTYLAEKFSPRPVRLLLAVVNPQAFFQSATGQTEGRTVGRPERGTAPLVRYFDPCDGMNGWLDG